MDFKTNDKLNKYIRSIDDKIDYNISNGYKNCSIPLSGFLSDMDETMYELISLHYEKAGYSITFEENWMGKELRISWS